MKKMCKILLLIGLICSRVMRSGIDVQAEEYVYDELNRVTKVTYDDGSYVEYSYDSNGNITDVVVHEAEPSEEEPQQPEPSEPGGEDGTTEKPSEPGEEDGTTEEPSEPGEQETETPGDTTGSGEESDNPGDTEEEPNIVEKLVSAIEKFFKDLKDWFQSLF